MILQDLDLDGTTVILIDETSCAKGHSYISNVIDYLTGDVIYCKNSRIEDVESLGGMLESHFDGILFWHSYKITNGAAEGRNSVIQAMKASSRGYANVDNMIAMVYLKSTLEHPSIHPV